MKTIRRHYMSLNSCKSSLRGCSIKYKSIKMIKPATKTKTGIYEIRLK